MVNSFEAAAAASLGNCPGGEVFLAAVSGGADSTAMLAALVAVRPGAGFVLHCIHVDHGIRPPEESRGDADFVVELCEKLAVPCRIISIPPGKIADAAKKWGMGMEAAARYYRRRAWNREARRIGASAILVAHTRDDLLETVLMRVLRGSGPAGLAAMPARRGRILRPLLELGRAGVLRYLEEKNISYRTDRTNADNRFFRNAIRNRLVPLLDDLFPRWRGCLQNLAETQRLAADFLAAEAERRIRWEERAGELRAGAEGFFSRPAILREEALFLGIDRLLAGAPGFPGGEAGKAGTGNPPRVKRRNLRRFSRGDCAALDLGRCRVRRTHSRVILAVAEPGVRETGFSLLIKAPGSYNLRGAFIEVLPGLGAGRQETADRGFYAALPLALRSSSGGDTLFRRGKKTGPGDLKAPPGAAVLCAVDAFGVAAFITLEPSGKAVLSCRDAPRTETPGSPEARGSGEWNMSTGDAAGYGYYYVIMRGEWLQSVNHGLPRRNGGMDVRGSEK
jgi:tRNA(Ile)-lysidine synthase